VKKDSIIQDANPQDLQSNIEKDNIISTEPLVMENDTSRRK